MATSTQRVTRAPAALAGLADDGTQYRVQASGGEAVRVLVAAMAPAAGADGFLLLPGAAPLVVQPASGESVYVWADGAGSAAAVAHDTLPAPVSE